MAALSASPSTVTSATLVPIDRRRTFSIIFAATTGNNGIGYKGELPWPHLIEYTQRFTRLTTTVSPEHVGKKMNAVIMGRRTWESFPVGGRPLKDRWNIVITSNPASRLGTPGPDATATSLTDALNLAWTKSEIADVFVIGGARPINEGMDMPECKRIFKTRILNLYPFDLLDTFVEPVDGKQYVFDDCDFSRYVICEDRARYVFDSYTRREPSMEEKKCVEPVSTLGLCDATALASDTVPSATTSPPPHISTESKNAEEQQYLDLVRDVIEHGVRKSDRTGIGTLSKFGCVARYSLRDGRIPLLTTKRVFWRGVVEELLWLIAGKTSARDLQAKGVHIWDSNGTKTFLESIGQGDREEFDLGPIYGHQWRHFGAPYVDCHTDYKDKGIDQLTEVVDLIKRSPDSRRIVMSAWNPMDLKRMALPPCHVLCQFYVANGELSCVMYQRSCDLGLGVPFNIASYSLLTHMIAHVCGLRPGEFCHMMGDTHVYLNHVEPLKEQIVRTPTAFPIMRIRRPVTDIGAFTADDFELVGYKPQGPIKMDMAV